MRKKSFEPPIFVAGRARRAHEPTAAIPTACTNDLRPTSVLIKSCAFVDNVFSAAWPLPFIMLPTTPPRVRSSNRLKPAAIPVIDGCGTIIFLRAIVLLRGLLAVRRRVVLRRRVVAFGRRARLDALKARQPFLNPILAYFLGSPGLGTRKANRDSHISATH